VGPLDRLLDFRRVDSMPGNMAGIVQIPIEASNAIQHSHSIYKFCIYNKAPRSTGKHGGERFSTRRWNGSGVIEIPQWPGPHDRMYVFWRKRAS
jgi:hypothetical protein